MKVITIEECAASGSVSAIGALKLLLRTSINLGICTYLLSIQSIMPQQTTVPSIAIGPYSISRLSLQSNLCTNKSSYSKRFHVIKEWSFQGVFGLITLVRDHGLVHI